MEKLVMAADPLGFELKNVVKEHLAKKGYEITDLTEAEGIDYYLVGKLVGEAISAGKYDKGFIFCGTGMGVNIVANKYPGVYCGLCENVLTAKLCRIINNCNVLSMGGIVTGPYKATQMADAFLEAEFTVGGPDAASPEFLRSALSEIGKIEDEIYHP